MNLRRLLQQLADAGVSLFLVGETEIHFRAHPGKYTLELRESVNEHRREVVDWLRAVDLGTMPTELPARVSWLAALARRAGFGAEALFALINQTVGYRTAGPYEMDAAKAEVIASRIRAEFGKRPPIEPAPPDLRAVVDDTIPASIRRKVERGWSDARCSEFCTRVLGRRGLRSANDDRRVFEAMRGDSGGNR